MQDVNCRDIYDWTWNTIRYIPSDKEKDVPSDMTALQHLATLGFTDRSGSAAVFAATFGTLAKNLGYDVQVISGGTPHAERLVRSQLGKNQAGRKLNTSLTRCSNVH